MPKSNQALSENMDGFDLLRNMEMRHMQLLFASIQMLAKENSLLLNHHPMEYQKMRLIWVLIRNKLLKAMKI